MANDKFKKIYWLKLKLELLPCLQKEVDKVCADYMKYIEEARYFI